MMSTIDLTESTRRTAAVVRGTAESSLDAPTPCEDMPVRLMLAHLHGLAIAFHDAARKVGGPTTNTPPDPRALVLPEDWRELIPARLEELAAAWNEPGAWSGMTTAGGVTMPAGEMGLVALDEVVLHGWDLAVATGQDYVVEPTALDAVEAFCSAIPDDPAARNGLFGPRVAVPEDAGQLERVLGLAGRDPRWRPTPVDAVGGAPAWEPPLAGSDAAHLTGTLERLRATFRWKADGLTEDQLRTRAVPSSELSIGGLLKHLAVCEDDVFCWRIAGRPPVTWTLVPEDDVGRWQFTVDAGESAAQVYALWEAAVARSRDQLRQIVADGALDEPGHLDFEGVRPSIRRHVHDLIEEYGRHTGHMDLLREAIDGRVGEDPPQDWPMLPRESAGS